MHKFEKKDRSYIVKSYLDGWAIHVIAKEYGVSPSAVRRVLVEEGVEIRKKGGNTR